jgi:hypothetical protein
MQSVSASIPARLGICQSNHGAKLRHFNAILGHCPTPLTIPEFKGNNNSDALQPGRGRL